MLIQPPPRPDPRARLTARGRPRRRLLRWMVGGSVALHVLLLALLLWFRPKPAEQEADASDQVAMVFESNAGSKTPSMESAQPSPAPSAATGAPDAPLAAPTRDTQLASLPPPPAPQAPPAPTPAPPLPTPPLPPQPTAPPPTPAPPTPPQIRPPPPKPPPPTVTLNQDEGEEPTQVIPPYVPPVPPPPLPPLPPRVPPRPRAVQRSPFANPQDFSFNSAPELSPGRASRGLDFSVAPQGSQTSQTFGYVAGAKPTGDWVGALKRWVQDRAYYPEEAISERQDGAATVEVRIDRSGRVVSLQLVRSSRSPFLDGAWQDVWRRATVPPFTPDMQGQDTTIVFTMHYILRGG